MAEGFASGFQQGFGLVNSVFDREADQEYRQNAIEQRAAEAAASERLGMGRLKLMEQDNKNNADYRQTMLERQIEADALAADSAAQTKTFQAEQGERSDAITEAKLKTERIKQQGLKNKADYDLGQMKAADELAQQGLIVNNLFETLEAEGAGTFIGDPQTSFENMERVSKGMMDVGILTSPLLATTADQVRTNLKDGSQGREMRQEPLVKAMNIMLRGSNNIGVGNTIDETYVNAPDWMTKGPGAGSYKIVGKEIKSLYLQPPVRDDAGNITEPGGKSVSGEVLVTVSDGKGEYYYTAPATDGRGGGSPSGVNIDIEELVAGFGGYMTMANAFNKHKARINTIRRQVLFKDKDGRYDAAKEEAKVDELKAQHKKDVETGSLLGAESPIPGMTNDQFMKDEQLFNQWAVNRALFPDSVMPSAQADYQMQMTRIRNSAPVRAVEADFKNPIDEKTLQNVQPYLDTNPDGVIIIDPDRKREFQIWRNGILGRGQKTPDPVRRTSMEGLQANQFVNRTSMLPASGGL